MSGKIITLCGSARFEAWFKTWNLALTLAGHTVFSLAAYPSDFAKPPSGDDARDPEWHKWYSEVDKLELDAAHRRKIDASDAVLILNPFGYIGESTLKEIAYAQAGPDRKEMYALESWAKGQCVFEAAPVMAPWERGMSYKEEAVRAARSFGVLGKGSPIDTFSPYFRQIWDGAGEWNLLGPGGDRRTNIVQMVKARIKEATGGGWGT